MLNSGTYQKYKSKMKKTLLFICLVLCLFSSCHNEDHDKATVTLSTFDVRICPDNTLRAEVSAKFTETTSFHIEYWETGDEKNLRKTKTVAGQNVAKQTLILLKPKTKYSCRISYGDGMYSEIKHFVTREAPTDIAQASLLIDDMPRELSGYLLVYMRKSPGFVYLLDTKGTPVWYEPIEEGVVVANLDTRTNLLYMITKPVQNTFDQAYTGRFLKIMDLWGNIILEKDLNTVPEMANRKAHHECRPLPNGDIIFVNSVDKVCDLSRQGGTNTETVTGDGFTIMDMKGNVIRQWDCFDTLDPRDTPKIMDIKQDWLHANSVNYDAKGDFYMTFNRPSELWKIDSKTGKVVYRAGKDGTLKIPAEAKADGMHCANPMAENEVLVLDNARDNTRGSRALLYKIKQQDNMIELALNCEIPRQYSSPNRSNAQLIDTDMLLFGSSVKNLILFTDRSRHVKIHRIISLPHMFYRAEYIPNIEY